jgi:TolA-binding protein
MTEEQASQKIDLSEVMLAMDVVDTLRHQRSLVERELQSEDREADLIEKLRKIYADQGLEVSDEVIAEGVKAMREERFAYRPPPGGLKTKLARMYVNRGRWAKRAIWVLVAVAVGWAGYRYLYVMPAERSRSRLVQELKTQASSQLERLVTLQEQINAASGELEQALQSLPARVLPAVRRLSDGARQSLASATGQLGAAEKLGPVAGIDLDTLETDTASVQQRLLARKEIFDRAQADLASAQAAIRSIRSLGTEFDELDSLRTETLQAAREKGVAEKIDALYTNALSAVKSGDLETAKTARQALQYMRDMLEQEYSLQIVSRPGSPSGVWRYPVDSRTARNYYLIVEAVSPTGQRLKLPITSEEDGKVRAVSEWGLRVEPQVYEEVKQDKLQDGIVDRKTVGIKKRGYLTPEYTVATTGGTITEWLEGQ